MRPEPGRVLSARALRARAAIEDLLHHYCSAIDRLDAELLTAVFADDARITKGDVQMTRGEFVQGVLRRHVEIAQCSHAVANFSIRFISRKLAAVEAYGLEVERQRDAAGDYDLLYRIRYLDLITRTGGRWAIREKTVVLDHVMRVDVHDAARELKTGRLLGRRDGADPAQRFAR